MYTRLVFFLKKMVFFKFLAMQPARESSQVLQKDLDALKPTYTPKRVPAEYDAEHPVTGHPVTAGPTSRESRCTSAALVCHAWLNYLYAAA